MPGGLSPAPIQKSGPTGTLDFYEALRELRDGERIARAEWPDGEYCLLQGGRLHIRKADGTLHQWLVSDGDMDGADWMVIRPN